MYHNNRRKTLLPVTKVNLPIINILWKRLTYLLQSSDGFWKVKASHFLSYSEVVSSFSLSNVYTMVYLQPRFTITVMKSFIYKYRNIHQWSSNRSIKLGDNKKLSLLRFKTSCHYSLFSLLHCVLGCSLSNRQSKITTYNIT